MTKLSTLCLLFLFGCAQAKLYSVGMNFRLVEESIVCTPEEQERIFELTLDALEAKGYNMPGNSGRWKNNQEKETKDNGKPDPDAGNRRDLLTCTEQKFLCRSGMLYYCYNCPCCGSWRRLLVSSERRAQEMEPEVAEAAIKLMNERPEIACLQYPPEVICNMA
jgi:hypothetical protein